jgi:transposase-like protein
MDVLNKPGERIEFTPEFWRGLVERIVAEEETLGDLAREMGIPRDVLRKWALLAGRAETAESVYEPLVPARRVHELEREVAELRILLGKQTATLQNRGKPENR